jgi:HAE1 family hydrophobic/amphiphilic exporter-1
VNDEQAAGEPVPASSGGAREAQESAQPSGALHGYTDQFEVLKVNRRPNPEPNA